MVATFHHWTAVIFLFVLITMITKVAISQPVIAEEFLYGEHCPRSASSTEQLRKHIDLIMDELQRQNQENILLKEEVEELKIKHKEQKILLSQLMDTVASLVQKIKHSQKSCVCETRTTETYGVLSGNISAIEAPETDITSTLSSTSDIPDTGAPSTVTPAAKLETTGASITDVPLIIDTPSTFTSSDNIETSELPDSESTTVITSGQTQTSQMSATDESTTDRTSETTETLESSSSHTSSHRDTVTSKTRSSGYVVVYPRDCQDLRSSRPIFSGQYTIFPINASKPFRVYCQVEDDTAWTVVQRRDDGEVDFYRNWTEYREGFGRLTGEFWIGNEHLHELTRQATYKLRIDMWDWTGTFYHAESSYMYVGAESEYYALHAPDDYYAYSGFVGSGLRVHRGSFMTYDRQDPSMISDNCAKKFKSGWWFSTCVRNANLNGRYYEGGYDKVKKTRNIDDIYWHSIPQSLKKVVMKLYRIKEEPFAVQT